MMMSVSINNPADIPTPCRGEIEIDGERVGYALVDCDVRSDEHGNVMRRAALARAGKPAWLPPTIPTTCLAERLGVKFMYGSAICL
jgi:hypothetical protein